MSEEFTKLNEVRRLDELAAERVYKYALYDYNEQLCKAYRKYHDRLDEIEKLWLQELKKIDD